MGIKYYCDLCGNDVGDFSNFRRIEITECPSRYLSEDVTVNMPMPHGRFLGSQAGVQQQTANQPTLPRALARFEFCKICAENWVKRAVHIGKSGADTIENTHK